VRTRLGGAENVANRCLVHVAADDLALVMRAEIDAGISRGRPTSGYRAGPWRAPPARPSVSSAMLFASSQKGARVAVTCSLPRQPARPRAQSQPPCPTTPAFNGLLRSPERLRGFGKDVCPGQADVAQHVVAQGLKLAPVARPLLPDQEEIGRAPDSAGP
jgi:hypothetical protein